MNKSVKQQIAAAVLLVITILLAYLPFYINGGFLGDFGDPIGQTIPNKFLLVEYIKNGIIPLWNPFSFLGFPFLADIQVGAFYLPDILTFSIFPLLEAHNISTLFHIIFAAFGIYLFSKKISKSKFISFSLSLAMVLAGSFLSRIVYLNFLETIAFIPWILLIIQYKKIHIPLLSISIALMIFAGHPVALFYSLIIIFTFFLLNHIIQWKSFISGVFLGFLISSIQILPFIFLKNESVRDTLSYSQFIEGSLQWGDLFMFINPFRTVHFDNFIHFGTIAFLCLLVSVFFVRRFSKKLKKIYFAGLFLFVLGILLGLGGNFPIFAKILYELPIFNIIRVPARYILLSHFGALLSLIVFFTFLLKFKKKLVLGLLMLIVINSFFIPYATLNRYEISEAKKQYSQEIRTLIENENNEEFSLNSTPSYFLSSSFFLFPNRHILNFMPNVIGYNPMILKRYYEFFPVAPVGSFENPNYFTDYYDKLELVGLKYYIFPTADFLDERDLGDKKYIIDYLKNNGWENLGSVNNGFEVWENKIAKPFIYFANEDNKITSISFKPGSIKINAKVTLDDKLVVNQTLSPGWIMTSNIHDEPQKPDVFGNIIQSYNVQNGVKEIEITYKPKEFYYGAFLSLIGISLVLFIYIRKRYTRKN